MDGLEIGLINKARKLTREEMVTLIENSLRPDGIIDLECTILTLG